MVKYKRHGEKGKSIHIYLDVDLITAYNSQENKTRYINDAVRHYMRRKKK